MENTITEAYIYEFLKRNALAVLSTVDEKGHPHAAPIYYFMDEGFNFFFVTPTKTQKYVNIKEKKEAVLTITDEETKETVGIRGHAQAEDGLKQVLTQLAKKLNGEANFVTTLPLLKFKEQTLTAVKVQPSEIRFRKYTAKELEEKVLTFESKA